MTKRKNMTLPAPKIRICRNPASVTIQLPFGSWNLSDVIYVLRCGFFYDDEAEYLVSYT